MGRLIKTIEQKPALGKRSVKRKLVTGAGLGYGMMLLVMFITSTVLIGTSIQMLLGNGSASYLGTYSQDAASASEVAQSGMETVLSDIQSKINVGTSVTTAYTYNSNTSSTNSVMPTDPSSLGGGNTTIGTYTATMTAARGNMYLVKVIANVNTANVSYSKLFTISRIGNLLDSLSGGGANAAYSVRKLRSGYNGSAIRVRRSSDNTEQDIGFDGSGNLDVSSLKTFLSASTLPLDSVGSAAAAFGLRKLRVAYTGYCLNVRRSSDNATQDIGFTSAGDLDVTALLTFVGTGTGYVTTWYDQSGNARNATQGTTTFQPIIVTSGVLNMLNNRPIITFDGVDDALVFSNAIYNDITIMAVYNTIAGYGSPGTIAYSENILLTSDVMGVGNDYTIGVDTSGNLSAMVGNPDTNSGSYASSPGTPGDSKLHWLAFTRTQGTAVYSVYSDGGSYSDTNGNTASLNANANVYIGFSCGSGCGGHSNNSYSEVLAYSSVLSDSNRQLLERNEGWYYNLYPVYQGWTPPVDAVTGAKVAYSLRHLRAAYTWGAIEVRRTSDNTTKVIGWDSWGNLDVASLLSFVGAGSGYVKTFYDQSGNGKDLFQNTNANQPRIVNAGVLDTMNGHPMMVFSGSQYMSNGSMTGLITGANITGFLVGATNNGPANNYTYDRFAALYKNGATSEWQTLNSMQLWAIYNGYNPTSIDTEINSQASIFSTVLAIGVPFQSTCYHDSSNNIYLYVNGAQGPANSVGTVNLAPDNLLLGAGQTSASGVGAYLTGTVAELIIYNSALTTANRQTIERNQMTYHSVPLPPAYVSKWYDQSGNGNDMLQTNPMLQPTLVLPPYGSNTVVPTVMFNGGQSLSASNGMPINSDYSKVAVFSYFDVTYANNIISSATGGSSHALYMSNSNYMCLFQYSACYATSTLAMTSNTPYAVAATYTESSPSRTGVVYRSNSQGGTGSTGHSNGSDTSLGLGLYGGCCNLAGTINEAMVFARSLSIADQTTIYNDERAYFSSQ